jgi:uncharacterized protein (DUF2252 family)
MVYQRNIVPIINHFNHQRHPIILEQKYHKMSESAFSFFRGTAHLFYQDLAATSLFSQSPSTWICGDLHLENFGTYKGDDRQIYFGINDFDEGSLAPCTWDVSRLVTSIFVAADSLQIDPGTAHELAESYLAKYTSCLRSGQMRAIYRDNSQGMVADLLADIQGRDRSEWLDERTKLDGNVRSLKIDGKKLVAIDPQQRYQGIEAIAKWAKNQTKPEFFNAIDVGYRVAGTSSLGLDRYLFLVEGNGSPDRNYLLDLKEQPLAAIHPYLRRSQPEWQNQATRVMTIQNLVQIAPPALMGAIEWNAKSYLLRELQPTQDKIDLMKTEGKPNKLGKILDTMAIVTAAAHLHGSGKKGADPAQSLMDFADHPDWHQDILTTAANYAKQVQLDYQSFCDAMIPKQ